MSKVVSTVLLSSLMISCSGSGGGAGGDESDNTSPDQFVQSLIRQTAVDSSKVDRFWLCADKSNQFSFLAVTNFENVPVAYSSWATDSNEMANIQYQWKVVDKNSLELIRENGQLHEELTYVNFTTVRSFSVVSSIRGSISCSYHNEAELDSLFRGEASVGELLKDESLLPVLVPDSFDQLLVYLEKKDPIVDGFGAADFVAVALYDNGLIPYGNGFNGGDKFLGYQYRYELSGGGSFGIGSTSAGSSLTEYPALRLEPALADEKLDACVHFTAFVNSLPGSVPGTAFNDADARWCFYPDGRFTIQGGFSWENILNKPFLPSPTTTGRYRLDGYAIRAQFDSGYQVTVDFGWRDKSTREALILDQSFVNLVGPAFLNLN